MKTAGEKVGKGAGENVSLSPSLPFTPAHPPLLLHRAGLQAWLPDFTPRLVVDYRQDEELRVFQPNPHTRGCYYYAVDVARIAGRKFDWQWVDTAAAEIPALEFCRHSGLAPWALYLALKHGTLGSRRSAQGIFIPGSELRRFI